MILGTVFAFLPVQKPICEDYNRAVCERRVTKEDLIEQAFFNTDIRYCMGGNGPKCYDCGGIVTHILRQFGYKGEKVSSHTLGKFKSFKQAKRGDILINTNSGQRHVAWIAKGYESGKVVVLDYATDFKRAKYRDHKYRKGVLILDGQSLR